MYGTVGRMKFICSPLARAFAFTVLVTISLCCATTAQEDGTRGVKPEEFVKARPAKAGAKVGGREIRGRSGLQACQRSAQIQSRRCSADGHHRMALASNRES